MNGDREQLIAARAYQLWEEEGRPHGAHQRHWEQATREIEASEGERPSRRSGTKTAKAAVKAKPSRAKAKPAAKPKAKAVAAPAHAKTDGAKNGGAKSEPAENSAGPSTGRQSPAS
jgi:Protein of unknown function (DUF2934)